MRTLDGMKYLCYDEDGEVIFHMSEPELHAFGDAMLVAYYGHVLHCPIPTEVRAIDCGARSLYLNDVGRYVSAWLLTVDSCFVLNAIIPEHVAEVFDEYTLLQSGIYS